MRAVLLLVSVVFLSACGADRQPRTGTKTLSVAQTPGGQYISWKEHLLDSEDNHFVTTRSNSGNFDGLAWRQQVHNPEPAPNFRPARVNESAHLPMP